MPILGRCQLCLRKRDLQKSHYIPHALYPTKRQKALFVEDGVITDRPMRHLKEHLLCEECELRFSENGESEAVKWLAPKWKRFPIHERLRVAWSRQRDQSVERFSGHDVGVDSDKLVYFAASIVWRGAIHEWRPESKTAPPLQLTLGPYQEILRRYLIGEIGFPHRILAVIVLICSDAESRQLWAPPRQNYEAGCQNYKFLLRGAFFRVMLGEAIPELLRDQACSSARKCIQFGDCSHRTKQDFKHLLEAEFRDRS